MAHNKYQKLKLQYSTDGLYWYDVYPPQFKAGSLIEENSPDCGGTATLHRWYALTGKDDYICQGYNKYYKEVYQESTDGGKTWVNVEPEQSRPGELIEANSIDCDYGIEWKPVDDEYICEMIQEGDECFIAYRTVENPGVYTIAFRYRRNDIWYTTTISPSTDLANINLKNCEPINEYSYDRDGITYLDLSHANMVIEKNENIDHIRLTKKYLREINVSNVKFNLETTKYDLSYALSNYSSPDFEGGLLKTIIGLETWDLSKVQSMYALLSYNEVLESDIIFNDTAKVLNNIDSICHRCKKIKNFKLPLYNLESGISLNMGNAFGYCNSLANIFLDGAELLKNKKINNLESTFRDTQITNFTFENCEINGTMNATFVYCKKLQTVIFNNCTITSTDFSSLFAGCINLTDIQLNNCTINANDPDCRGMFSGCKNLKTIKASKKLIDSMITLADKIALPEAFRDVNYSGWIINT